MISVRRATDVDVDGCVRVLEQLPEHFTPDTYEEVRASMARHPAWVAVEEATPQPLGFVLVEQRHPAAAEITFAAVLPERWGHGIGTALVDHALGVLTDDGVALVEVKTLDASAGYAPYVATRAFWEARGFTQIDRIDPLPGWQPGNPAAIYVAALQVTR